MNERGYTLTEVLVVSVIVVVLTASLFIAFARLGGQSGVESAELVVETVLHETRRRTLASDGRQAYGVHFEIGGDMLTVFEGSSYSSTSMTNEDIALDEGVDLVSVSLAGGGSDVLFDRLEGTTGQSGSIILRSRRDVLVERTLFVLPSGQTSRVAPPVVTDSRNIDTRHVHYDLGWSIQGGGTMALRFEDPPNPDVVETVDMSCCYNVDQSEFDWSGVVDVGGSSQTMRIHTHLLNATDTLLSIHRDLRENDRAIEVQIQGNDIVRYEVDGTITIQAFGGTATVQ